MSSVLSFFKQILIDEGILWNYDATEMNIMDLEALTTKYFLFE